MAPILVSLTNKEARFFPFTNKIEFPKHSMTLPFQFSSLIQFSYISETTISLVSGTSPLSLPLSLSLSQKYSFACLVMHTSAFTISSVLRDRTLHRDCDYHRRLQLSIKCAPSTRKESVLMEADTDMNMLKFFDHSPPLYLHRQFFTNFWFLIQFLVSFILYILYQELA
ncbi:unnamed protein product [Camellia sinensis]